MILLIETSSTQLSIALCDVNGNIIIEKTAEKENAHAEKLAVLVEQVFLSHGNTIKAVGICNGPGSYTGLRIGTSFAKGLCYALEKPLLALNSFTGMVNAAKQKWNAEYYFSILDARRDEVYIEGYTAGGRVILPLQGMVLNETMLKEYANKNVCICGNATEKWERLMPQYIQNYFFSTQPKAAFLAMEAAEKFKIQKFEDLAYYVPYYLKNFIPGTPKKTKS